jgi:hypothetical protein
LQVIHFILSILGVFLREIGQAIKYFSNEKIDFPESLSYADDSMFWQSCLRNIDLNCITEWEEDDKNCVWFFPKTPTKGFIVTKKYLREYNAPYKSLSAAQEK